MEQVVSEKVTVYCEFETAIDYSFGGLEVPKQQLIRVPLKEFEKAKQKGLVNGEVKEFEVTNKIMSDGKHKKSEKLINTYEVKSN